MIRIDDWNMFPRRNDTDLAEPTHYSRRNDELVFWPNPDAEYTIRIKYRKTIEDLQTAGPEIPQEWHELILWGAINRGLVLRGDLNRAQVFRNMQAESLQLLDTQETKELEDVRYSGFMSIRPRYP